MAETQKSDSKTTKEISSTDEEDEDEENAEGGMGGGGVGGEKSVVDSGRKQIESTDEIEIDRQGVETDEGIVERQEEVLGKGKEGEKARKSFKSDSRSMIVNEAEKKPNEIEVPKEINRKNKCDNESEEDDGVPPALPPRPPRPRQHCTCSCGLEETTDLEERLERRPPRSCWMNGLRKYVFLCTACGLLSLLLGALFLTVYFMLKSYTSSLNHFETIPTYVPSGMLVATGFLIICLAWRKNRNSFLMKLCGLCSLCSAVLCVSVTVTTTVIHMNRLQTLRECLYTQKTQSCTCYSILMDNNRISDEGIKFVFNSTPDCEVIHGALYSCLRAIFGLSVIGILVCIFSCMLVYQLLGHEKKKMYWAQLEMRCRYLYRQQRNPHYYGCCEECRYPPHSQLFPWELMRNRFWSTGRIGNLYTPNPEDRGNHNRLRSGWNWRRLPWNRGGGGGGGASGTSNEPTRANLGSPDSQYGFSSTLEGAPYTVLDPRTANGIAACPMPPSLPGTDITEGGFYSWGPPPPYASNRNSANNSPARRSLGELLNHVSPVRRNDNVSPSRNVHHIHRHHTHHNRRCGSSPRQMTNDGFVQSDPYQKSTPSRNTSMTSAVQQQQQQQQQQQEGMNALWSNSLSSDHRFQKVTRSKDNYENMYEPETNHPGFNTLPSLKKRNQTRVGEVFQNESFTAYFFSSAENLGCSTSNLGPQSPMRDNEGFPPRVFLTGQSNVSKYGGPPTGSVCESNASKSQNESIVSDNSSQSHAFSRSQVNSVPARIRPIRSTEKNTSLVKKLFVNCSPTKQKPKITHDSQPYSIEKKETTPKRMSANKMGEKESYNELAATTNENVITFHYRVGIPRSPNVQNFGRIPDKPSIQLGETGKGGSESWTNDRHSGPEISQSEDGQKMVKGVKYLVRDVDLLQKHNSLIREFNRTLDLGRNLKCRDSKSEPRKMGGIENVGFQQSEDSSKEGKPQQYSKNFHGNPDINTGNYPTQNSEPLHRTNEETYTTNKPDGMEDYSTGNAKSNENESDVYFGDVSNSSWYGPESLPQEESSSIETGSTTPRFSTGGHHLLNKQNLKMIEAENLDYDQIDSDGKQHPDDSSHAKKHQSGYRQSRLSNQFPDGRPEDFRLGENFGKNPRRSFTGRSRFGDVADKIKYFSPVSVACGLQESCLLQSEHHHESINSNDEHSSSSMTADSGISSGKSFAPKCYDNYYHEMESRSKDGGDSLRNSEQVMNFEVPGEKYPCLGNKISTGFDNLGDFAHPLFQKPKVLPRGSKYRESDSVQASKKPEVGGSESENDEEGSKQNLRNRTFGSVGKVRNLETVEEVSNQLLSTCNLTLSTRYMSEDGDQFKSGSNEEAEDVSGRSDDFDEEMRKSPKPLPRTTVFNKTAAEEASSERGFGKGSRCSQKREKINHFLAPDAQYDFQEDFKPDSKSRTPTKHGEQCPARSKPPVSARPFHLQESNQKKVGKVDGSGVQGIGRRGNESVRPLPRRRRNGLDSPAGKDIEIGTHSVNV